MLVILRKHITKASIILITLFFSAYCQRCPTGWEDFHLSCYKFVRAPFKNYEEARMKCQAYNADLVSVNNLDEHKFIAGWLRENDPQHRRWYTSGRDDGDNLWLWDGDNTQFSNIDDLWLQQEEINFFRHAAYNYSAKANNWGLHKVSSADQLAYICEIPKERLHQIIITEKEIDYGLKIVDREKIPRGPYFIHQPQSVIFDVSGRNQANDVSLRCVAGGYPHPVYTWCKEDLKRESSVGCPIDPLADSRYTQTDGTLIINNPEQNQDRGKYHCTASNKFGSVISQTVQISFEYIPDFNKKRSPDYGRENWGKSISCDSPHRYTKINYAWARDSFPIFVEEDRRVFVSHDGNLYFSSLEKVDAANYSCNVQSVVSSTGRRGPFFPLKVESASSGQKLQFPNNFPKAFPEAPLAGQDVRLECVAYGYPVPSYNWTRVGITNHLPEGVQYTSHNRVLILPKIKVEDMGEYMCTASNGIESIRKSISLSIQALPEFTIPLGDKVVDSETKVTWTCEAFGIPDVTYSWLKNGSELNPDRYIYENRYRVYENVLTIENVSELDEDMYQCKATNQLGSTYSSGQLRVLAFKPTFAKYPLEREIYATELGNVTIPCRPEAAPFPRFKWKFKGTIIDSMVGRVRILNNGYLFIHRIRREDEGLYTCMAENKFGRDESSGKLIVLDNPRLLAPSSFRVEATVNETVPLQCEALVDHGLDVAYIWLQNGLRIESHKQSQFTVDQARGFLYIYNVSLAEAGLYQCIVKTAVGYTSRDVTVNVNGPPGPPGAVLAESLTATSAVVHWSDGSDNGKPILGYNIEGQTNHNKTWIVLRENIVNPKYRSYSKRKEAELSGVLSPWSTYSFRVSAFNILGQGPPSDPSPLYNTDEAKPQVAPANVGGGGGKTGSLTITWDPLPQQEWNAKEIWYKVFYRLEESTAEFNKKEMKELGNIGLYVVNVGEENYYKPYTVKVQAINSKGEGPKSKPAVIYSAERMPSVQPSQVRAEPFNSTALNVSWTPPKLDREKMRGKLIGYRIKYYKNGADPIRDSLILLSRGTQTHSLIVGLQPNTEYRVSVMAYNDAGSGVESEPQTGRTYKSAPLRPPTSVNVKAISPTSVLVTWRGVNPSIDEEPIVAYKVRYWEADQSLPNAKEVIKYLDGRDLEAVVSGLTPGKVYKLRVMAYSLGGDGKMSHPPWEFLVDNKPSSASSFSTSYCLLAVICHLLICYSLTRHL